MARGGMTSGEVFDYIIIGGGAAGSVLANRLTENLGTTVCVLEAGPPDRNPLIHIPAGFMKTLFDPACTWQFKTEPTARHRRAAHPHHAGPNAGRLGSDQRHDLQPRPARRPRQLGAARQPRLGLCRRAALLQAHRAAHRRRRRPIRGARGQPAGDRHGLDPPGLGSLHRGLRRARDPALRGLQQRRPGRRRLLPARDPNGRRISAARAFLQPAMRADEARGANQRARRRILFEGKRAAGVRYLDDRGAPRA